MIICYKYNTIYRKSYLFVALFSLQKTNYKYTINAKKIRKKEVVFLLLSIIVPCYNEEKSVIIFYNKTQEILKKIKLRDISFDYEYIFVNDGSKDKTLHRVKGLNLTDNRVKYINFSRNFGKEAGLYAGLKESNGDYVVVMDVDLQDPPEYLEDMYISLTDNPELDCVATRRKSRDGEPPIRSAFAKCFYKLINKMTEIEIIDGARDYRMMTRKMVNSILQLSEKNRFSKGLFSWVGFKTEWISYENVERVAGETKWSFWKLFKYAIEGIISFTTAPLMLSYVFSLLFGLLFLISIIVGLILNSFIWILTSIIFISASIICLILGIQSLYISKMYTEIKNRPIYIVKESNIRR